MDVAAIERSRPGRAICTRGKLSGTRDTLHQQNNGRGPGFAVLGDFPVIGRFRPFAISRLAGKGQQHDLVAVPRAFQYEGALVGGQQAPLEEKVKWDADFAKRTKIKEILEVLIPDFSVRIGGATSIDITKPGIDKAYGIRKLKDILGVPLKEMIYVGDALFPGGNDYPAEQAGVISFPVRSPNETRRVIEAIIACLDPDQQVRIFEAPVAIVSSAVLE